MANNKFITLNQLSRYDEDLKEWLPFEADNEDNAVFKAPVEVPEILVTGKLDVRGESTVTSLEKVTTPQNTIILREGAQGSLSATEYTGIVAENYDGENTGVLVFDANGTAYVGDMGEAQPLATRDLKEEDDNKLVQWDNDKLTLVPSIIKVNEDKSIEISTSYDEIENAAEGAGALSLGRGTQAISPGAVALGTGTIAAGPDQLSIGRYNEENSTALLVVGNGSGKNQRSNVLELYDSGSAYLKGEKIATAASVQEQIPVYKNKTKPFSEPSRYITLNETGDYFGFVVDGDTKFSYNDTNEFYIKPNLRVANTISIGSSTNKATVDKTHFDLIQTLKDLITFPIENSDDVISLDTVLQVKGKEVATLEYVNKSLVDEDELDQLLKEVLV